MITSCRWALKKKKKFNRAAASVFNFVPSHFASFSFILQIVRHSRHVIQPSQVNFLSHFNYPHLISTPLCLLYKPVFYIYFVLLIHFRTNDLNWDLIIWNLRITIFILTYFSDNFKKKKNLFTQTPTLATPFFQNRLVVLYLRHLIWLLSCHCVPWNIWT